AAEFDHGANAVSRDELVQEGCLVLGLDAVASCSGGSSAHVTAFPIVRRSAKPQPRLDGRDSRSGGMPILHASSFGRIGDPRSGGRRSCNAPILSHEPHTFFS